MKRVFAAGASILAAILIMTGAHAASTLDIYFIDVEGGQSTLLVTPTGHSLLIDTGFEGFGERDPNRILAAAHNRNVTRLDTLLITHFHADHVGGAPQVMKRLPVATFVDDGQPIENSEATQTAFSAYMSARSGRESRVPRPGDRLRVKGIDVEVLSAGGAVLRRPTQQTRAVRNPACATLEKQPEIEGENPRSIGVRITFGSFVFLDLGDLPGTNLAALACPDNLLGHADLYLVPHHGNKDTAIPAVLAAVSPRVAILNNGATKGGDPASFTTLREASGLEAVWQLHRSLNQDAANYPDEFIANLEDGDSDMGSWLKVSAEASGAFSITNGRSGQTIRYSK